MAASPGYNFGGNTGLTYDELQARRKVVTAMMAQQASRTPQNLGEGLQALGQGLMNGFELRQLRKEGEAMRGEQDAAWGDISAAMSGSTSALAYDPARTPAASSSTTGSVPESATALKGGIVDTAKSLGIDPVDLGTAISYETAGTFDPTKSGPTTQWGQHRGLIQFGEPQAQKYGVDWNDPAGSQLGANGAIANYLRDAGVKPGMGMMDIYSAINAGKVGRYDASDAGNGGAPGTVADKVNEQMAGHRAKALALLGDVGAVPVQVASLDPSAGMGSAAVPTTRQALQRASATVNAAHRSGASIDGQMSPEDQARYNTLVGRQPGQVDPNTVPYTGLAEYNTPELRLDTNGARVTRDSEEAQRPVRQALVNAAATQAASSQPQDPTQLAALPSPQTVQANPTPPSASAFSPEVQQAMASDPAFDGFAQTGAPQDPKRQIAQLLVRNSPGLPEVPAAPDFGDPNMTPVQRVAEAQSIGQVRNGADPTQAMMRVLRSPHTTGEQKEFAAQVLQRVQSRQDRAETRSYEARQAELARRNGWEDYQRKGRFDAELKANDPDTVLDRRYKQAQIDGLLTKDAGATDDTREYEYAVRRGYTGSFPEWQTAQKKAGASSVTIGGGENKQVFDAMADSASGARASVSGLKAIRDARQAIDAGGIFGAGADTRLGLQKVGAYLGVTDPAAITNTETFRAAIAPQVSAMLKSTVGSANISNTDREFAEKAAGGNITLEPASIKRLLTIMEKASTEAVAGHMSRLDKVYPSGGQFERERALFGVDMPDMTPTPYDPPPTGSPPPAPATSAPNMGSNWPQGGQVSRPRTDAEFNAIPKGGFYVDPEDGKTYRK